MAQRVIRTDEDPILRKQSRKVENINDRLKILIDDMFETMDAANGVGLAAPQVGILKRVITVDNQEGERFYMINPEIVKEEGCQIGMEGCLSIPEKQGKVQRANVIDVNYMDLDGNELTMHAEEFLARILQHEIDHLNGILYSDRADEMYNMEDLQNWI